MQYVITAGFLVLFCVLLLLILGPVVASFFVLVAFSVLLVAAVPVLILLAPWIVIGCIIFIFF